jgi:hypothetical protein
LQSLDLEYHRLDLEEGLYFGLEKTGQMRLPAGLEKGEWAILNAPETTRALIRGKCVSKFGSKVTAAQWDHVVLQTTRGELKISLLDLFEPDQIKTLRGKIDQAKTTDELIPYGELGI